MQKTKKYDIKSKNKSKNKTKTKIKPKNKNKSNHNKRNMSSVIREMRTIFKTKMCNFQEKFNIRRKILIKIVVDDNETKRFINDIKILKKELENVVKGDALVKIISFKDYKSGGIDYQTPCFMLIFIGHIIKPPLNHIHRASCSYLLVNKTLNTYDIDSLLKGHVIALCRTDADSIYIKQHNLNIKYYPLFKCNTDTATATATEKSSCSIDTHTNKSMVNALWVAPMDLDIDGAKLRLNKTNTYKVGESLYTKSESGKYTLNFNFDSMFIVRSNDIFIKSTLKRGFPYAKYISSVISSYIYPNSIVYDIGANIGTVAIAINRAAKGNVTIIAFEPYQKTWELLRYNIMDNCCGNIIPLPFAVGHKMIDKVSLSGEVIDKHNYEKYEKYDNMKIEEKDIKKYIIKDDIPINYGAVQLGVGGDSVRMVTIDHVTLPTDNVSLIKIDIEGAESLAFYGGRETIRRCMPVIAYERNYKGVTEDMKKSLNISNYIANFEIVTFCKSIGYKDLYEIESENFMLVPPNRKQYASNKHSLNFVSVDELPDYPKELIKGFNLYKYLPPLW